MPRAGEDQRLGTLSLGINRGVSQYDSTYALPHVCFCMQGNPCITNTLYVEDQGKLKALLG